MKITIKNWRKGDEVIEKEDTIILRVNEDTPNEMDIIIRDDSYLEIRGGRECISVHPCSANVVQIKTEKRFR